MTIRAEDYLPILLKDGVPDSDIGTIGTQIGDVIISGEDKWHSVRGTPTYDLLLADGSLVDTEVHILLSNIYVNLPTISDEVGSPFPYKVVADLTPEGS